MESNGEKTNSVQSSVLTELFDFVVEDVQNAVKRVPKMEEAGVVAQLYSILTGKRQM